MNIQISNQPFAKNVPSKLIPADLYRLNETSSVCLSNILLYILLNIPTIKEYIASLQLELEPLVLLQKIFEQNFANGFKEKLNLLNIQEFFQQFSDEIVKIASTFSNKNTFEEYLNEYSQVWVLQGKGKFIDFAEEYIIGSYVYELFAIGKRVNKAYTVLGKVNGDWFQIKKKKETLVSNWKKCYKKMEMKENDEIELYFIYSFSTRSKENAQNKNRSINASISIGNNENTKFLQKIKNFSISDTQNVLAPPIKKRRGYMGNGTLSNGKIQDRILVDNQYIWYCQVCQYPNDYDETSCEICKADK